MNDLMIDIETLGKSPGSVILSIGAVWFDATTGAFGDEFYAAINPQSAISSGLKMDVSTVQWWMKQSDDARAAAFSGERILGWALGEFGDFVRKSEAKRIWAKPPSFDLVLLEAAFAVCSIPIPWEYWTPRDCRTLFEISKVKQAAFGTAHNALDDAKAQAAGVIEAYRVLGLSEPPPTDHAGPVAWLRPGEYVPIQGCPFGAMWISDKDDPRAFPVYKAQQPSHVPQEAVGYISRDTFAELLHDNSGKYEITTPHDLMGDDLVPIFTLPGAHPSDPTPPENAEGDAS
jgi:hypothetical protein